MVSVAGGFGNDSAHNSTLSFAGTGNDTTSSPLDVRAFPQTRYCSSAVARARATVAVRNVVRKDYVIARPVAFPVHVSMNVLCICIFAKRTVSAARDCVNAVLGTRGIKCVKQDLA
jgi:hypothetical protein